MAVMGPLPVRFGATPTALHERICASALFVVFGAASATAAAASLMPEELPAVTVKPSISGCNTFRPASDSIELPRRGCSSSANVIVVPSACGTWIGTISSTNEPASIALTARW
ncbi:Uncharacterised protein [Mycobacterium tuberculosis]|nr:Uncharacterised protein [Mycobacterium tuberculosis]